MLDEKSSNTASVVVLCTAPDEATAQDLAAKVLAEDEVRVLVELGDGVGTAVAWGCDLSYDYVKINGDYRT